MKKTVLISAYAVNPFKGSEDGTGWNISKEISKKYQTIIVTRKNNQSEIERFMNDSSDPVLDNMTFLYHDLPQWAMTLKKKLGERGYVLYFYFWQLMLPFMVKRGKFKFDLSFALNFHSDSTPNFLWILGKPVIWGPIGHHPSIPNQYLKGQSLSTMFTDKTYNLLKWAMRNLDPFFYIAKFNAKKIIAINSSVQKVIKVADDKIKIIPAVGSDSVEFKPKEKEGFNILSVGRFHAMKGFDVAILAFARFYKSLPKEEQFGVKLTLVGKGVEEGNLRKIIIQERIEDVVKIISWVPKSKMDKIYREASVFLFPSHEGAGMVVPEAMSYRIPVLCFDNVGPGELIGDAGVKVAYGNYNSSINAFSKELKKLYYHPDWLKSLETLSFKRFHSQFTWIQKGIQIRKLIKEVMEEQKKAIAVFHPSAELYGADRILVNALKALPAEVTKRVYLFRSGPLVDFMIAQVPNVEVVVKPEMPVIYRKIFNPIGILKFCFNWIGFLSFMRLENKKFNFESAYVNTLSVSFLLPLLSILGIKKYVHVHEIIDNPKIIGKITAWLSYQFADKIVCVSNAVFIGLKRYVNVIDKKIEVIHNGIDAIEAIPQEKNGALNFYLFGRIKPEKGQWFLIDALSRISKEKLGNSQFVLMGGAVPGQEAMLHELEQKIQKLGLENNVQIKGFSPCIATAMSKADVCLIPSIMKDPFPTTVLEAMSASKTVITTNHGGAKEAVLNNETGFLIDPHNYEQFAITITQVIEQRANLELWGSNAKKRFQENFTIQNFHQNWLEFNVSNNLI